MSKSAPPFKIKWDSKNVEKWFDGLKNKEIPKAISDTLNHMANGARKNLRGEMESLFKNPTSFTLNMFYVKPARSGDPTAWIGDREWAGKGNAARDYLMPEIQGGIRPMKGSEKLMMAISGGKYWVPGPDMPKNAQGKVSRGEIIKILSRLKLFNTSGYKVNFNPNSDKSIKMRQRRKNARGQENEYFVARDKDGSPYGIYKYTGKKKGTKKERLKFLIQFVNKKPTYQKTFPVPDLIDDYVEKNFERICLVEIEKAKSRAK
ncbi:hypothetical protein FAI40_01705 [Acetobacteraceae bacterium]|nr:hypothetical protein FAI40_01705 [Acetobacteraceae bacterium]